MDFLSYREQHGECERDECYTAQQVSSAFEPSPVEGVEVVDKEQGREYRRIESEKFDEMPLGSAGEAVVAHKEREYQKNGREYGCFTLPFLVGVDEDCQIEGERCRIAKECGKERECLKSYAPLSVREIEGEYGKYRNGCTACQYERGHYTWKKQIEEKSLDSVFAFVEKKSQNPEVEKEIECGYQKKGESQTQCTR